VKRNAQIVATGAVFFLLIVSALGSAAAKEKTYNKLIDSAQIMERFAEGRETVRVIVNLEQPPELGTAAIKEWHSPGFVKDLQAKVKARQQQVLSSLPAGEFRLHGRFSNQAGFFGDVALDGLDRLLNHPAVKSIEPDHILEPHLAQGVPLINGSVYRSTYNGQGVAIAICDSGIDYNHSKLGGGGFPNSKVIGGYDTADNDSDPFPTHPHGTCCAGIAAGDLGTVGDYIGGVAHGAKLYALKIEDSSGYIYDSYIVNAWNWCVTHKNDDPSNPILVISTSVGGGRFYSSCDGLETALRDAANNAVAAGITLFVSSGNEGWCDSISSPACLSNTISVGAVYDAAFGTYYPCISEESCASKTFTPSGCLPTSQYYATDITAADKVTSYSNTASFLDLLASSNEAYTTDIVGSAGYSSGDYDPEFGGTSAASPYAAGAAACLQSAVKVVNGSYFSPTEVKNTLVSTGDLVTDGKVAITKPRVNLGDAIGTLAPTPPMADDIELEAFPGSAVDITLVASDDGQPDPPAVLSYIITSLPAHGSLTDPQAGAIASVPYTLANGGNTVAYTSDASFAGTDQFTYKANDGGSGPEGGDSNIATIQINVSSFFDYFPSTTLDSFLWPSTSGAVTVDSSASNIPSPPYALHLERTESVTSIEMDLSGASAAQVTYYWQRYRTESGDDLYVDYWDGAAWQRLMTHLYNQGSTSVFTAEAVPLHVDALHAAFKIRFEASCNGLSDEWYIDDVNITSTYCDLSTSVLYAEPNITAGNTNTVFWEPLTDADEYFASCANDTDFNNVVANSGWISQTNFEFGPLELGETYWYRVKARSTPEVTTWSQTTEAEFLTDTLVDTNATSDGNVVLAGTAGSYLSSGSIVSTAITLPEGWDWDIVNFARSMPIDTELTVDVLDGTDPCETVLLEDIAWGMDISTVGPNSLKLRANLATSDPCETPVLADWSVSYVNAATLCQTSWSNSDWSVQCGVDGDFQPDCVVDGNDLAAFVLRWLNTDCNDTAGDSSDWCYGTDITHSSVVDFPDYARMAANWLSCIGPWCP